MIYTLFAFLGLPEPSLMVAALASTFLVLGTIFGLMFLVVGVQVRSDRRRQGTITLRAERQAKHRYLQFAAPVEALVKPALLAFQEALFRRDGITYPDIFYEVHENTVVLRARRASVPHPLMLHLSLELNHSLFDPDQPLEKVIWEKVLARQLERTES